jgi:hypothetical protein
LKKEKKRGIRHSKDKVYYILFLLLPVMWLEAVVVGG